MARPVRVFQIAKELNISHTEILSFLKDKGVEIASHMSPVDEATYQLILVEFAKDKERVDRFRKEQVRREIHDTRRRERQAGPQRLKLLSLDEQRAIEDREKEEQKLRQAEEEKQRIEEEKRRAEEEARQKELSVAQKREEEERRKREEEVRKKAKEEKARADKPAKVKSKKQKLRKISLSEIQTAVGQGKRQQSRRKETKEDESVSKTAQERVRQTMAKLDKKSKRKIHRRDRKSLEEPLGENELKKMSIAEFSSVDEISKYFNVSSSEIIQKCFSLGILATINQRLEWEVIELLAEEYGYIAEKITDVGEDLFSLEESEEDIENAQARAPVVTIMGHVDHGKTSLLDFIRKTNVVGGESGGITQHIGAYKVELEDGKSITFLDTPGHEAFTAMRARGAQVTDIVVLVVAADDAVMPQTIEAIDHARAANVPMVVAINKMDKPGADPDKVKRELSEHNVLVEDWGGKVQSIPVSAKTGDGIEDLMNAILMEAELLELKANRDTLARGTVIDSRLDKGHGPVATVLIQKGTLRVGDPFICSDYGGKVRAIMNERGQRIEEAGPSSAVQLLGFEHVPQAADIFAVVANEKSIKRITADRQRLRREIEHKRIASHTLDAMSALIKEGEIESLPLIIKGDVDGSIDALAQTFEKLNTDEVGVNVIHKSVGMVTESDVLLAETSKAVIIGFNVQVASNARLQAKQAGVEIRTYNIIYNAVEDIKLALEGMLKPDEVEEIKGRASVLEQFKIPKIGFIAGCKVSEGVITRNAQARLIRNDEVIHEGKVTSLKRFKDDAREVKEGLECGIAIEGVSKYETGDIIEVYEIKQVKRKLETR